MQDKQFAQRSSRWSTRVCSAGRACAERPARQDSHHHHHITPPTRHHAILPHTLHLRLATLLRPLVHLVLIHTYTFPFAPLLRTPLPSTTMSVSPTSPPPNIHSHPRLSRCFSRPSAARRHAFYAAQGGETEQRQQRDVEKRNTCAVQCRQIPLRFLDTFATVGELIAMALSVV